MCKEYVFFWGGLTHNWWILCTWNPIILGTYLFYAYCVQWWTTSWRQWTPCYLSSPSSGLLCEWIWRLNYCEIMFWRFREVTWQFLIFFCAPQPVFPSFFSGPITSRKVLHFPHRFPPHCWGRLLQVHAAFLWHLPWCTFHNLINASFWLSKGCEKQTFKNIKKKTMSHPLFQSLIAGGSDAEDR